MGWLRQVLVLGSVVLATGCAGGESAAPTDPAVEQIAERTLDAGAIPEPEGDPVLTVVTADGERVEFDLATLERLRRVQTTVFEPFVEQDVEFSGVVLWEVLEAAGASEASGDAALTALDDYRVELPLDTLRDEPILLATRSSGEAIPVEDGGPTRVVFPEGTPIGDNPNMWIWSVKEIVLE